MSGEEIVLIPDPIVTEASVTQSADKPKEPKSDEPDSRDR